MKRKILAAFSVALALLGASLAPVAEAGPYEHGRGGYGHHWAGGYHFRYYHYDPVGWRGGRWIQTWHGGRYGWWWFVGGAWMLYPSPVYPYPDPALDPVYVVEDQPATVVAPVQEQVAPPPAPAPEQAQPTPQPAPLPQVRYYCNSPQGYYPYVPACPSGWQTLPAAPAGQH